MERRPVRNDNVKFAHAGAQGAAVEAKDLGRTVFARPLAAGCKVPIHPCR